MVSGRPYWGNCATRYGSSIRRGSGVGPMDASLGFGQTDRSECLHGFPAVGGSLTLAFVDYTVVATFPPESIWFLGI